MFRSPKIHIENNVVTNNCFCYSECQWSQVENQFLKKQSSIVKMEKKFFFAIVEKLSMFSGFERKFL